MNKNKTKKTCKYLSVNFWNHNNNKNIKKKRKNGLCWCPFLLRILHLSVAGCLSMEPCQSLWSPSRQWHLEESQVLMVLEPSLVLPLIGNKCMLWCFLVVLFQVCSAVVMVVWCSRFQVIFCCGDQRLCYPEVILKWCTVELLLHIVCCSPEWVIE